MIDPKRWPDLSRLLDAALDIPRGDRDRWLESLSPPDVIHREELRILLRHDGGAETQDFLGVLPNMQPAADSARAADVVIGVGAGSGLQGSAYR